MCGVCGGSCECGSVIDFIDNVSLTTGVCVGVGVGVCIVVCGVVSVGAISWFRPS